MLQVVHPAERLLPFLASTDIFTGLAGSKYLRTGVWVTSCLRVAKLVSWCSVHCHCTPFSSRVLSGAAACERFGMSLARYVIMPKNRSCSLFSALRHAKGFYFWGDLVLAHPC